MEYIECSQCQRVIRGCMRHQMMRYENRLFCDTWCLEAHKLSTEQVLNSEAPAPVYGQIEPELPFYDP